MYLDNSFFHLQLASSLLFPLPADIVHYFYNVLDYILVWTKPSIILLCLPSYLTA